eukprot:3917286-Alexandrium_andersonii.AAC.1
MAAQLPLATCVLTGRRWEMPMPRAWGRPYLATEVLYPWQSGPACQPETSDRGRRRPGELGEVPGLAAAVLLGAPQARTLSVFVDGVNVPFLATTTAGRGWRIFFLGEFTLASARHAAT